MGLNGDSNRDSGQLRPPSFGKLLRRLREDRGVSRERLAFNAGVSASYVTHLEKGDRGHPTHEVVDALVRYLDRVDALAPVERRHLFDLAGLANPEVPSVEELRAGITPDMRDALALHEPHLAAYLDTRWNVLACNESYARAFPGLREDVNILRWFLANERSRQVMVEWDEELRLTVQWLRSLIATVGDTAWSTDLLAELGQYEQFRELWDEGAVAYGRERSLMRLRDLDTGEIRSVAVQLFRVNYGPHPNQVQIFLGLPTGADG
ncbi:helix-turn-helix transcriptional regulator [Nocardia yamanashiensis]|uniref:helix-turn-helix transcriptional regulator n=1 Tax=Nocardia yamanashiensis TaxID=209247 RepID=UPI0012FD91A9|nr:helix-turn-helix transcriptional regulator [Nocardia yamanashiensis]